MIRRCGRCSILRAPPFYQLFLPIRPLPGTNSASTCRRLAVTHLDNRKSRACRSFESSEVLIFSLVCVACAGSASQRPRPPTDPPAARPVLVGHFLINASAFVRDPFEVRPHSLTRQHRLLPVHHVEDPRQPLCHLCASSRSITHHYPSSTKSYPDLCVCMPVVVLCSSVDVWR